MKKKVLFITGTRADYGKVKSLIKISEKSEYIEPYVYVTGMHMLQRYGNTSQEVLKDGYKNVYMNVNQHVGDHMEVALANTANGMSHYIRELNPDIIVIHGDRLEALAGAIVGVFCNILVAHIEGGELSGTVDDSIRHSISKLAHIHFVCNEEASHRLIQMGESKQSIFPIGSPDYDLMFDSNLPSLSEVLRYYEIPFGEEFGILLFHPVTTESSNFTSYSENLVNAINKSHKNFIVIYPNNDLGSDLILEAYEGLSKENTIVFPSLSFERFVVLLKNSKLIVGNSSAGIREAPCYGIPSINIGDRQNKRFKHVSIIDVDHSESSILDSINNHWEKDYTGSKVNPFGDGNAAEKFIDNLEGNKVWKTGIQKTVFDNR